MYSDEIIEKVWKNRDEYASQHQNDLHLIIEDLKKRQKKSSSKLKDRRELFANVNKKEV